MGELVSGYVEDKVCVCVCVGRLLRLRWCHHNKLCHRFEKDVIVNANNNTNNIHS